MNISHMDKMSLNENELEVLRILWEEGPLKTAEIQSHFAWLIENATLRSVLVNLIKKKHLSRTLRGKAFYYAARVPKATLLQKLADQLAWIFAGGSHKQLVAQLVETADIKPEELALLRRTAEGAGSHPTKPKSK